MRPIIFGLAAFLISTAAPAQEVAPPPDAAQQTMPEGASETAPTAIPDSAPAVETEVAMPPAPSNPSPNGPFVTISTSMGDITLQLYSSLAPKGAANFLRYVREKHYDGTVVYRVDAGFVIQMGSWDANINGRPVHPPIPLEANSGLSNLRGTVAYAHGDDPRDGGQAEFFINLKDNTGLDQAKDDTQNKTGFSVFAQVVAGMDVVDKIGAVPVGDHGPMPGSAPITPIVLKKVSVMASAPN